MFSEQKNCIATITYNSKPLHWSMKSLIWVYSRQGSNQNRTVLFKQFPSVSLHNIAYNIP